MEVEEIATENLVIIFRKGLTIDYDQPVDLIVLPRKVKSIDEDIWKIKNTRKGIKNVELVLVDLGSNVCHETAKKLMTKKGIKQAGVHEIILFCDHLPEDLGEKVSSISVLGQELRKKLFEHVPTICIYGKKTLTISLSLRDALPSTRTYFLGMIETDAK